jgi:hypothetical protein
MTTMKNPNRLVLCSLLATAALVLASCGGSGAGLIPAQDAGPLQSDFEAVARAAQTGSGNCTATAIAIRKTERDFELLPATVNSSLRRRLQEGIVNLHTRALVLCAQPLPSATTTNTSTSHTSRTTSSSTTTTTKTSTSTPTETSTSTASTSAPSTSAPGGGALAPGEGPPEGVPPGHREGGPHGNEGQGTGGTGQGTEQ